MLNLAKKGGGSCNWSMYIKRSWESLFTSMCTGTSVAGEDQEKKVSVKPISV